LSSIASYSYLVAALAFLVLSVMLTTRWRSRTHAVPITFAAIASCLWSAALAWQATREPAWSGWTDSFEVLRNAGWSAFLIVLIGNYRDPASRWPLRLQGWVLLIALCYVLFFLGTVAGLWHLELIHNTGLMPSVTARVAFAVLGIVLVEQLYRNKSLQERWAVKFACLGIGAMFAFDFYLFSNTMLFHQVDHDIWAARGVINALTMPLVAISVSRSASWSSELSLSRRVMFHTAALFGSAIYLLAMGSAGYYLRFVGGSWGTVMQVAFLFGALMLLVVILFSGTFRSWLKVSISKHFYRYNYDYREEWLRFTRTLSESGPGLGVRTIQAVAELVESPGGVLFLRRESGLYEPEAYWHVPVETVSEPADSGFCLFLETKQWVVDLDEYTERPELYEDMPLPAWLASFARAWLVVPLMMQGKLSGFMLLMQPRSRVVLNWEVIDLLKIAGNQAASYLAQQDAANALMVARQFESFNRMSTFVVHDLKNLVSQLSLLIPNAEKHRNNPEFQRDMLDTVNHSVQKMKLLLQKLSRSESPEHMAPLEIDKVIIGAVALKAAFEPHPVLELLDAGMKVLADRERLERVLGHLIQNAIEATPKDGKVSVSLRRDDGNVRIAIADTGEGMSDDFIRERLFKPFESTKSAGMGIGVFESHEYISELGGKIELVSEVGVGTTFHVILPLYQHHAQTLDIAA
jgi:putative PEP-CTERM system histidine kinase